MAIKKVIVLGEELCVRREGIASAAITPGHLLQGLDTALAVHATAGGTANKKFAYERELTGDGIDVAYAANDTCLYAVCPPGTIVYAIADAGGVTANDIVESAGDGTLRTQAASAATANTARNSVVGRALDTAGAGLRFRCEIY